MKNLMRILSLLLIALMLLSTCSLAEEATDEWYRERADVLAADLYELSGSEDYINYFVGGNHLDKQISTWHKAFSAEPMRVKRYLLPYEGLISLILGTAEVELPPAAQKLMGRNIGGMLISLFNGQEGVNFLAASSVLYTSEGYIMPENFIPCMLVYEYDGVCIGVYFTQSGEGVVSASAQVCSPEIQQYLVSAETTSILESALIDSQILPTPDATHSERNIPASKRGK